MWTYKGQGNRRARAWVNVCPMYVQIYGVTTIRQYCTLLASLSATFFAYLTSLINRPFFSYGFLSVNRVGVPFPFPWWIVSLLMRIRFTDKIVWKLFVWQPALLVMNPRNRLRICSSDGSYVLRSMYCTVCTSLYTVQAPFFQKMNQAPGFASIHFISNIMRVLKWELTIHCSGGQTIFDGSQSTILAPKTHQNYCCYYIHTRIYYWYLY